MDQKEHRSRKVATISISPSPPPSPPSEGKRSHEKKKKIKKGHFHWLRRLLRHMSGAFLIHQTTLIESFPASLDMITSFYRFLGFSFSACRFVEVHSTFGNGGGGNSIGVDNYHQQPDRYQFKLNSWSLKNIKEAFKRYLGLLLNLFLLFLYLAPFLRIRFPQKEGTDLIEYANQTGNLNNKGNYTAIHFEDFGHFTTTIIEGIGNESNNTKDGGVNSDISQLKPILRMIMEWLLYVFMLNGFFSIAYNLLFGGALLHHLVGIGEFADLDDNRSLGTRLLGSTLGAILAIKLATMSLYQSELIKLFFDEDHRYGPNFERIKRPVILINLAVELLATTGHYLVLAAVSVLFLYSMIMFKRSIEVMQADLLVTVAVTSSAEGQPELDEMQLTDLKDRLYRLNEAFKRAVRFFSVPLTLDLMANCYMLIGKFDIASNYFFIVYFLRFGLLPHNPFQ